MSTGRAGAGGAAASTAPEVSALRLEQPRVAHPFVILHRVAPLIAAVAAVAIGARVVDPVHDLGQIGDEAAQQRPSMSLPAFFSATPDASTKRSTDTSFFSRSISLSGMRGMSRAPLSDCRAGEFRRTGG